MKRTTIYLSPQQHEKLEAMAIEYGYVQVRGSGTGKNGSISQLIQAIAEGEIELVKTPLGLEVQE